MDDVIIAAARDPFLQLCPLIAVDHKDALVSQVQIKHLLTFKPIR